MAPQTETWPPICRNWPRSGIRARDAAVHLSTHPEKVSGEPRVAWQAGVEATSGRQSRLTKIRGYVFAQPQPCGLGSAGIHSRFNRCTHFACVTSGLSAYPAPGAGYAHAFHRKLGITSRNGPCRPPYGADRLCADKTVRWPASYLRVRGLPAPCLPVPCLPAQGVR